jgi:hypothetical protein
MLRVRLGAIPDDQSQCADLFGSDEPPEPPGNHHNADLEGFLSTRRILRTLVSTTRGDRWSVAAPARLAHLNAGDGGRRVVVELVLACATRVRKILERNLLYYNELHYETVQTLHRLRSDMQAGSIQSFQS